MSVHTTPRAGLARGDAVPTTNVSTEHRPVSHDRMIGIDAARGLAMVLVCLSHVRYHVVDWPDLYIALTHVTRIATPTFLLLSGFVAAHVLSGGKNNIRLTLFDRGLFVLIVGHLLLNLAELRIVDFEQWMFARVTVTDAIAVCLMSTWLLNRLSARWLAIVGTTLALVAWPIAMIWTPESQVGRYLAAVLFSAEGLATDLTDAAVVPYLGLFMIGMSLSRWSASTLRAKAFDQLARRLFCVGSIAIAVTIAGIAIWHFGKGMFADALGTAEWAEFARRTLDPRSKLPPSPAYLLFYSGAGLLVAAACLARRPAFVMKPIVTWAATLGRASLMCFILQDWLLLLIPALLQFEYLNSLTFWILYFIMAIAVLHFAATRWDRAGGNRWLTMGLKRLA